MILCIQAYSREDRLEDVPETDEMDQLAGELFDHGEKFGRHLLGWLDRDSGVLKDPVETIYSEGYGPAISAHIFARLHAGSRGENFLEAAARCMDRSLDKLRDPTDNGPFTDIFIFFWALKTLELIERSGISADTERWRAELAELEFEFEPSNTNGYCLMLSTALMYSMLGIRRADMTKAGRWLGIIEGKCGPAGFVDDATRVIKPPVERYPGGPGRLRHKLGKQLVRFGLGRGSSTDIKPIAYHTFSCSVLCEPLVWSVRHPSEELSSLFERMREIAISGGVWISRFAGADGSLSMTERSRDQFWTAGSFAYLLAATGEMDAAEAIERHLHWWSRFFGEDGSCPVTPNMFPASARVGHENYSISTMYVTQGFSFFLDVPEILASGGIKADSISDGKDDQSKPGSTFIDADAGYAHIGSGGSSVGISLRRHAGGFHGGYTPAMGLFNVVIGGSALRPIPNPCYRTWGQGMSMPVRIPGVLNYGVYDGFRAFRGSTNWGPDLTKNTDIEELPGGIAMTGEFQGMTVKKTVTVQERSLTIDYEFSARKRVDGILVTVPILLFDGRNRTGLELEGPVATLRMGGESFRLSCEGGGPWVHNQERSLLSTSGLSSQLYFETSDTRCRIIIERIE